MGAVSGRVELAFGRNNFSRFYFRGAGAPLWFCLEGQRGVHSFVRFDYAKRARSASFSVGWRHDGVHEFCMRVLKNDWREGYDWLCCSGVIDLPCFNSFRVGDGMGWPLGELPIDDNLEHEIDRLCSMITANGWHLGGVNDLLSIYGDDKAPFRWISGNAALRLAEIAGICLDIEGGFDVFERCAIEYGALIQADMFNMGDASDWISSLRRAMRA